MTAGIVEGLENAVSGASAWKRLPTGYPFFIWERSQRMLMEYGKQSETAPAPSPDRVAELWKELQQGSETDIDVFLHVLSAFYLRGDQAAWVWAKDFLDARELKPITKKENQAAPRRAGHRGEDIDDYEIALYRLENIWLTIWASEPYGKKKPRRYVLRGRLINILDSWSQENLDGSERLPIAWLIQPGDGLREYLARFPSFSYLCRKAISYDPYRELWEKRLARYFFFHLRFNGGGELHRAVGTLLETNSLPVDKRNPERTRARLEQALDRLVADHFIDEWHYAEQVKLPARGWLAIWKQQILVISAAPQEGIADRTDLPPLIPSKHVPGRRLRRKKRGT
ncbi:MAG: hypothetical protein IRZ03_16240 [Acidobacterium ailaaui]|nr:hypothetical protein [Pseudacidobacterium ailaaui]